MIIIYPYRNRDIERIKRSLDSLSIQKNKNFEVLFIDYGSDFEIRDFNKNIIEKNYSFVKYHYSYHLHQPWSRPRAINIGLKIAIANYKPEYVFIADIDMIFRADFVDYLHQIKCSKKSFFFKVGYLSENETKREKVFSDYNISFTSTKEAQGLSLFPVEALIAVGSHDEYIHFWGADNDIHNRLVHNGLKSIFIKDEIYILHQWHIIYANENKQDLTKKIQLPIVSKINQHLQWYNNFNMKTKVNGDNWGSLITEDEYNYLNNYSNPIEIGCKIEDVLHFLYVLLPREKLNAGVLHVKFNESIIPMTLKYKIKVALRKKVFKFLSLKEINDQLLLHLISFYKNNVYHYKISDDLKSIELKILFK